MKKEKKNVLYVFGSLFSSIYHLYSSLFPPSPFVCRLFLLKQLKLFVVWIPENLRTKLYL